MLSFHRTEDTREGILTAADARPVLPTAPDEYADRLASRLLQTLLADPRLLRTLITHANGGAPPAAELKDAVKLGQEAKTGSRVSKLKEAYSDEDPLVPLSVVSQISGLGKTKIYELIRQRKFPAPYKPGGVATRWSLEEVREWRRALTAHP